jgi:hypothetical protein
MTEKWPRAARCSALRRARPRFQAGGTRAGAHRQLTGATILQIGRFGVEVLGCFGVSQTVSVWTKIENQVGIAFDIPALHAEFENRSDVPNERGRWRRSQLS